MRASLVAVACSWLIGTGMVMGAVPESGKTPVVGAQVFIEPGQSAERIDRWFALLEEQRMPVCRIRLFEPHMRRPDGSWDFSRYDRAFDAAERHGVAVFATLFPATEADDIGGFKFPRSEEHLAAIARYVEAMVSHFRDHPALSHWVLINEPGSHRAPIEEPFSRKRLEVWVAEHATAPEARRYRKDQFLEESFLRDENVWYLGWLAREVAKRDPRTPHHVNSHAIFHLLPEYDFARWRPFLASLGASMHPAWHFGDFDRRQYALAVSANNDIIRSGAGPLPYWVTELQGGNNIFSGAHPLCPTREEIAQWLWTSIGAGAEGVIFWTLNPRATGGEAGEWGMLTLQDQPTDRLLMAGRVAATLRSSGWFEGLRSLETPVTLAYTPESFWTQSSFVGMYHSQRDALAGRREGATILSLLAAYEALEEQGIPAEIADLEGALTEADEGAGRVLILAHQIAIPVHLAGRLERFVRSGGTLVVTGMTAYFDAHRQHVMLTGFPFKDLFGAEVEEYRHVGERFTIQLDDPPLELAAHGWRGTLAVHDAVPISKDGGAVLGVRHRVGAGRVVWVPSPLGLAAWRQDNSGLAAFLRAEVANAVDNLPFLFDAQHRGVLCRALRGARGLVTILVNKSGVRQTIAWRPPAGLHPSVLFRLGEGSSVAGREATLMPEEVLVVGWEAGE